MVVGCCHVWIAPVWQYDFGDVLALRVGCSHVSGLFMRHDMTAGPDVVRENRSLSHCRAVDAQGPSTQVQNVIKLQGREGFRLRVGDWRVIFDDDGIITDVVAIGPRGGIYE